VTAKTSEAAGKVHSALSQVFRVSKRGNQQHTASVDNKALSTTEKLRSLEDCMGDPSDERVFVQKLLLQAQITVLNDAHYAIQDSLSQYFFSIKAWRSCL
jgi:hypothetical protein